MLHAGAVDAHRDINLAAFIHRAARAYPARVALSWEGGERRYADLSRRIDALAAGFDSLGVRAGDRVVILLSNGPRWIETYFATVQLGAIAVPLLTRLVAREFQYLLGDAEPCLIVTERAREELLGSVSLPAGCRVLWRDAPASAADSLDAVESRGRKLAPVRPRIDLQSPASILYTSGTTGQPKGTVRSQQSACFIIPIRQAVMGIGPDTTLLATTPMFHAAGHEFMMFQTLAAGGRVVSRSQFSEDDVAELVDRERITHAFFVPTMAARLLPAIRRRGTGWPSLSLWCSAAAPLPAQLRDDIRAAVPAARLWNVYGVTEAGVGSYLRDDAIDSKSGTCVGLPGPGAVLRVVDESGADVAPGVIGEVILQSAEAMSGYWRRPEESAQTLREGWVHSGDLGTLDEDGYLYVVGRIKDMVITGGENVYAAEVENVLSRAPGVREITIIGVPHPVWGEAVVALAVVDPGAGDVQSAVLETARAELAAHKRPKRVLVVESLPKNSFGKVDKQVLRQQHAALMIETPHKTALSRGEPHG